MTKYGVSVPCKGCPNRAASCHSNCEKYAAYRKQIDHYNEIVHKQKGPEAYVMEQVLNIKAKQANRRRKYTSGCRDYE